MTRRAISNRKLSPPQARGWLCLVLSAVVLLPLVAAPAAAQGAPSMPGTQAIAAADPAAPPATRFSLDFVATDLVDVIKALAAQSGANIAVSSKVSGEVTLRLTEVTVEEALTVISKINGLEFARIDNTYVVGTPEEVKALVAEPPAPDQPLTEVVALQYVPAADAIAIIGEVEPQVKCKASPTGGLIMTAIPAAVERAKALLAGVDVAPAVGIAERAVYTIKYCDANELTEALQAVFPDLTVTPAPRSSTPIVTPSTGGGAMQGGMTALAAPQLTAQGQAGAGAGAPGGAGRQELSHVTKLILSGAPATLDRALALCEELDVPPAQVKISATITEVRQDVEKRLGINWQDLAGGTGITVGEPAPTEFGSGLDGGLVAARDLKLGKIMRSHLSIAGAINALVTEGNARIMANPTVIILDGRQATIHAGDKIYYPQIVGRDPLGGQIVQATQIDVGISLIVNPRIGPDGNITLTLVPTVSAITQSVFEGYPTITERSTVTTVRVKSGETLAIGGLIRDDETITVNKVPLLGDIPIIGDLLFKSTVKHPVRSEVVIIITPEVVES